MRPEEVSTQRRRGALPNDRQWPLTHDRQPMETDMTYDLSNAITPLGEIERDREKWIYKDLIHGEMGMIWARPKVGKSFLAVSAAMAMSEGKTWLQRTIDRPYKVLYWALDGGASNELVDRRDDLEASLVENLKGYGSNLLVSSLKPRDDAEWWNDWLELLVMQGIEYLFIDNLLAVDPNGSDVNSSKEMSLILNRVGKIVDFGIGVTVVHHAGKFNEERGSQSASPMGSTVNESKVRYLLHAERDWQKNEALMTLTGNGNAGGSQRFYVDLYPLGMGEDGAFVTLLHEEMTGGIPKDETLKQHKARALRELDKKLGKTKPAEEKKRDRDGESTVKVVEFLKSQSEPVKQGVITQAVKMHATKVKEILSAMEGNGNARSSKQGTSVLWELLR